MVVWLVAHGDLLFLDSAPQLAVSVLTLGAIHCPGVVLEDTPYRMEQTVDRQDGGGQRRTMLDKNGVEIKTGQVVKITGAYFKNDNGLYFVTRSPGDPGWCGSDHSLTKISKAGKISKAKYNLCFWPIISTVRDRFKSAEARAWNKEHAQIEVKTIKNMAEVAAYFQAKADELDDPVRYLTYNFGEDHPEVIRNKTLRDHFAALAKSVMGEEVS